MVKKAIAGLLSRGFSGPSKARLKRLEGRLGLARKQIALASREMAYPLGYKGTHANIPVFLSAIRRVMGKRLRGAKVLELGCTDMNSQSATLLENLVKLGADAYGLDQRRPSDTLQDFSGRVNFSQGQVQELANHFQGMKFKAIVSALLLEKSIESHSYEIHPQWNTPEFNESIMAGIKGKLEKGGHLIFQTLTDPLYDNAALAKHGFRVIGYVKAAESGITATAGRKGNMAAQRKPPKFSSGESYIVIAKKVA